MDEQKEMNHMRELVELLNRARRSYEQENTEIMSNYEYDKLYDELLELEETEGIPRRTKSINLLETGWTYCCSDLSERRTCEGSHQRKRSDR